jgi:hypothetical protein
MAPAGNQAPVPSILSLAGSDRDIALFANLVFGQTKGLLVGALFS